jgi:hypothetical protein
MVVAQVGGERQERSSRARVACTNDALSGRATAFNLALGTIAKLNANRNHFASCRANGCVQVALSSEIF